MSIAEYTSIGFSLSDSNFQSEMDSCGAELNNIINQEDLESIDNKLVCK